MIRITDKLTLRKVALDMALRRCENDYRRFDEIITMADKFAAYIQGMAELPEINSTPYDKIVINNNYYAGDVIEEDEDDVNDFLN